MVPQSLLAKQQTSDKVVSTRLNSSHQSASKAFNNLAQSTKKDVSSNKLGFGS